MGKQRYRLIKKIFSWYEKADKKSLAVSGFIAAIFISVALIFTFHIATVLTNYRELAMHGVIEESFRGGEQISNLFGEKLDVIKQLAGTLSEVDQSEGEFIAEVYNVATDITEFDEIVTLETNGVVHAIDDTIIRDNQAVLLLEKVDPTKSYDVVDNDVHFLTDDDSVVFMAPITHKGVTDAFVVGTVNYDNLVGQIDIRGDIEHDEVLVDDKGKVIALINSDSVSAVKNDYYFFDSFHEYASEQDYLQFSKEYMEGINSGTSGYYVAKTGEENILYIYVPIVDSDGWATIHCFDETTISQYIKQMLVISIISFILIIGLMFIGGTVITRHFRGERKKISDLEYLDSLTGIINRNAFVSQAKEMIEKNSDYPYGIMCLDVVNFRIINETYGHERSDEIIKALADACKEAFGINEVCARLTADVFVVLIADVDDEEERIAFIESKVTERAREVFINHDIKIKRGIYSVTDVYEAVDRMIDKANLARKYVDVNSSNLRCAYSDRLMDAARKVEEIESTMNDALAKGEFKPFLQAKYNMIENRVCGAEALVRWIKEDGTIVSPADFIPIFETNGFVEKIDYFMLEEICKYLRQMVDEGKKVYPVSVNQSRYLLNDPDYVNKVRDILLKYRIPIGLIELELTETVFFHEKERMIKMMYEMKDINVNLSIDDFGSGYSSFNILNDVPFDVLKIDRAFLSDSVHTEKGKWILREITEMAHGLGMGVVCEGVETKEQVDLLVSIGCHVAQGFYYARPIAMNEFIEKYNNA